MAYLMRGETKPQHESIKRGEIYWITRNPSKEPVGSVIWQDRPAVIVSNDRNNANREFVEVVYLTTSPKWDDPEHCTIRSASKPSTVLCEQICTIDKSQISSYVGRVTDKEMSIIEFCLASSLGLEEVRVIRKVEDAETLDEKDKRIAAMESELNDTKQKLDTLRRFCAELLSH